MTPYYDIIIIGKGLIGAAAARHLSLKNVRTAVIGPDEPAENENPLVYASHYDQARVQRIVGKDEAWTKLNYDSVQQYGYLQQESGLVFHRGAGCLYVNPYGKDKYLNQYPALAEKYGMPHTLLGNLNNEINQCSGMQFPKNSVGVLEAAPSGLINPRILLQAQLKVFAQKGGALFSETVTDLCPAPSTGFEMSTASGKTYRAGKVLVTTGSFLNYLNILPKPVNLKTKTEVILLVATSDDKVSEYKNMPSLLYESDEDETEGIYMTPPVQYPDGKYYLKIGANSPYDFYFENIEQIRNWFSSGEVNKFAAPLLRAAKRILPSLDTSDYQLKKCIISRTEHGRPYIGETTVPGIFLAGGCNGYSAMCSDGIGQAAANLIISGSIPAGYDKDWFEIKYI